MEQMMNICFVLMMWMFASAMFLLVYKRTYKESKLEMFILYVFVLPWVIIIDVETIVLKLIYKCVKKIKWRNK